ncbi:MAG: ATP-binding protein [Chloroflexota bacterium]|nr:MAG: hypothetical protein DIU68_09490 [Chloroflexota bacterium]
MSQSSLDFVNLFVRPPGDLIYFLVVVAVTQVALFMALGQRLRNPEQASIRRYLLASIGSVFAWAFLMVGALFSILASQDAVAILPPLERAVTVTTILLIGWAFLTADNARWPRTTNILLLMLIAVVILGYMLTGMDWPRVMLEAEFNQSAYGLGWSVVAMALSLLGAILIIAYFRWVTDAPLKLLYFAILLIGHGITIAEIAQGTLRGDYAGPARLAYLAALPILPVVIYRIIIGQLQASANTLLELPARPVPVEPGAGSERESVQLMRALGLMLEGASPGDIPDRIIQATLQVLQADIGVLLDVRDPNYADIIVGRDRTMQRSISGLPVNLESQPTLVNAIERRLQRPLYVDRNPDELRDLYTRFDIEQIGPVYFQPLVKDRELLAMLVVGLPYAGRELDESGQELLKGIGIIAANLLALSRAAEHDRVAAEERIIQAMVQGGAAEVLEDGAVRAVWEEMQQSLETAREQVAELNRQVTALKVELDFERSRVTDTFGDTDEGLSISQRIISLSQEQERLLAERDRLAARLREAETALAGATSTDNEAILNAVVESLHREKDELARQRERLEAQLAELRASRTAPLPQVVKDMLARMSEEKARLELEREELANKLQDIEAQLQVLGIEGGAAGLAQLMSQFYEQRAALQARNEVLQRERDALLAERQRFSDRIEREEQRERQLQALQNELKNVAADREAMMRQWDKLRAERDELLARQDSLKEQRARLTAQVAAFELELEEAYEEQARLRQQLKDIADQRSALIAERDRLLAERQALEIERDQSLARVEGDRDRLQQLGEDGVGSLTKIIDDLSRQRDQLERELNSARAEMAELRNRLEVLQTRLGTPNELAKRLEDPEVLVSMVQELRTPMTSIIGYVDLLLSESAGILGEMQRKFLQRVSANVTRLAAMFEDLINVTMLDTGQFTLAHQPVDVVEAIEDAITNAATQLREKGLVVHLNLDDEIPALRGDPDAINQIIGQLLTNAYLVSPPGSEIYISAQRQLVQLDSDGQQVNGLLLRVEDRGGGISPEDQPRVFSRKYKAENPLIQGLGDTGVGMSVAKALVEAHGGRIWVETRESVGSAFLVALPLDATPVPER